MSNTLDMETGENTRPEFQVGSRFVQKQLKTEVELKAITGFPSMYVLETDNGKRFRVGRKVLMRDFELIERKSQCSE